MKDEAPTITKFFLSVLASLLTAAIVANTAVIFRMSERLTAVETKLEILASKSSSQVVRTP
jgi:hypothetical protein